MRIDLPRPLAPGQSFIFSVDWNYNINDARRINARTGYEYFPADKNYIYEIAQWFPRMAAYYDVYGWQLKSFLGAGEFTLEYGDYRVSITVPNDHTVAASGVLQNPQVVLTATQRQRLQQATSAKSPTFVVTPAEANANETNKPTGKKTWTFAARERPRLRVCFLAKVHLGRAGCERSGESGDRNVVLSERGRATLVQVFY